MNSRIWRREKAKCPLFDAGKKQARARCIALVAERRLRSPSQTFQWPLAIIVLISAMTEPNLHRTPGSDRRWVRVGFGRNWMRADSNRYEAVASTPLGFVDPVAYGASGSDQTSTCSTMGGSPEIRCEGGVGDFRVNEGVEIVHAGFYSSLEPVRAIKLMVNGAPGRTVYDYALCTADPWRGIARGGCARAVVANGPLTLTLQHSISVSFAPSRVNAALALLYRKIDNGPWRFVSSITSPYYDIGWTPATSEGWPGSPPPGAVSQHLWSKITAISGARITLQDAVPTTVVNTTVRHDDTEAIQAAISAAAGLGVGVRFGAHTYRIDEPSAWSYVHRRFYRTFTPDTPGYPSLFPQAILQLPSGSKLIGAGPRRTILVTDFVGHIGGGNGTFGLNTGGHGNPFVLQPPLRAYKLNSTSLGAPTVVLQSASNAEQFSAGDEVFIWGGPASPATTTRARSARWLGATQGPV